MDPPGLPVSVLELNVFAVFSIILLTLFVFVTLVLLFMLSTNSPTRPGGPACGGGGGGIVLFSMGWLSRGPGEGSSALGVLCGLDGGKEGGTGAGVPSSRTGGDNVAPLVASVCSGPIALGVTALSESVIEAFGSAVSRVFLREEVFR